MSKIELTINLHDWFLLLVSIGVAVNAMLNIVRTYYEFKLRRLKKQIGETE